MNAPPTPGGGGVSWNPADRCSGVGGLAAQALVGGDLPTLLDRAVRFVARALGVEFVMVLEARAGERGLLLRSGVGWRDGCAGRAVEDPQAEHTLSSGEPVVVEDLGARFGGSSLPASHGAVSGMSVAIRGRRDAVGVLGAYAAGRRAFAAEDVDFLQGVAHVLGAAMEQSRAEGVLRCVQDFFDAAEDAVVSVDERQRIVLFNRGAEKMFGYARAEILGRPLGTLLVEQFRESHRRFVSEFVRGPAPPHAVMNCREVSARRKDDSVFPAECSVSKLELDRRTILTAVLRDVTERKRERDALREAVARFRGVVESHMIGIFFWDLDGRITDANDAFLKIVGFAREDLGAGSLRWKDMTPREHAGLDDRAIEELLRTGVCSPFEKEYIRKDGTRVPVLQGAALLQGYGNCGVCWILDISERRLLEEQLRRAQKMEAIGRLAGGVAHDFNNLMMVISGYSDMALRRLGPADPIRTDLEKVRKAGDRAAELTRQLLAFSRRQIQQLKVLDVNAVVAEMERMLRRVIGENIRLVTNLRADVGRVRADPGQLDQVIVNLVVNARDAMGEGGTLTIETQNAELDETYAAAHLDVRPGPYVQLAITDTGCGMDCETLAHIFEPFFTTKEKGKGTGLGLSTAYGIVKQSGGHIGVYSECGRGTTFRVYLPRVTEAAEPVEREPSVESAPRGTETVLLAEDEEMARQFAARILRGQGYEVIEASRPGEALAACERRAGPIHLLLTDVVMPQMSGRELAERLAKLRPQTKVLYISGYTGDAIVHHGVLDPGTSFLAKPYTPLQLARKVREVLDG